MVQLTLTLLELALKYTVSAIIRREEEKKGKKRWQELTQLHYRKHQCADISHILSHHLRPALLGRRRHPPEPRLLDPDQRHHAAADPSLP
jgi:hypothetical protein